MNTIIHVLKAAYMAQAAIERVRDITSAETAVQALGHYARVLLEAAPEQHQIVSDIRDHLGRCPPTLTDLHREYLAAWSRVYTAIHSATSLTTTETA